MSAGSQVGELASSALELSQISDKRHQVDCVVIDVERDFTSFCRHTDGTDIKQCHTQSGDRDKQNRGGQLVSGLHNGR